MSTEKLAYQQVVEYLLGLADAADDAGLTKEADAIAAVLPEARILKVAQYEGGTHYWLQNGRAFERAWMLKRRMKPRPEGIPEEDRKSAQDTWFEVLAEYHESLMGDHKEFLSKYAAKEEVERAMDGAGGGGSGAVMGPGQIALHKKVKDKSKDEGETEGEAWSKWLEEHQEDHRAAGIYLFKKISAKIGAGEAPGVALYEAIDDMASGREATTFLARMGEAVKQVEAAAEKAGREDLVKNSQFWQGMMQQVKNWGGDVMRAVPELFVPEAARTFRAHGEGPTTA